MESTKKFRCLGTGVLVILMSLMFTVSSCEDDDDKGNDEVVFEATLSGVNEVPSNASAASGDATLTYNESSNTFTIVVNYAGVDATAAHIHKGAPDVSGGIVFPFNQFASPITYTSAPLDSTQKADLFANLYYVNVHSAAYPAGEIRGQLTRE